MTGVDIRPRTGDDEPALLALAEAMRAVDGYPPDLPVLFPPAPAWVAVTQGRLVGHIALHDQSDEPVMAVASAAMGRPAEDLAVVCRLLVAPQHRRRGIGRSLLDPAVVAAYESGRWPVLTWPRRSPPPSPSTRRAVGRAPALCRTASAMARRSARRTRSST